MSFAIFIFMYVNDLGEKLAGNCFKGVEVGMLKLLLLLYCGDIVFFSENAEGLQKGLHILKGYCDKWKLIINTCKIKIMVFRKEGTLQRNLKFEYNGKILKLSKNLLT